MRALPPAWCAPFIGWTFERGADGPGSADCWGIVAAVLERHFGLDDVPRYPGAHHHDMAARLELALDPDASPWVEIKRGARIPGDVVTFDLDELHVGVIVGEDVMLHCRQNIGSAVTSIRRAPWAAALCGTFRHRSMAR